LEAANLYLKVDFTGCITPVARLGYISTAFITSLRDSRLNPSSGKRMPQIVEMKIFDPGFLQRRAEKVTGWKAFFDSRILLLSPLASARVQLGRLSRIIINH